MSLELYRRHNPALCKSTDTIACDDKRHPCPIWVTGVGPDRKFIRQSLRKVTGSVTRDLKEASKVIREWEEKGRAPKPRDGRATLQLLREKFTAKVEGENLSPETLRKYRTLFDQLDVFATNKGIKFVDELDYDALMEFRTAWKDGPLSTGKKLERLRGIVNFAVEREWITRNPVKMIKAPKFRPSPTLPFTDDEMQNLLKTVEDDPEARAFILTMRFSGLRLSDTATLALDKLKNGKLFLYQAKTGEPVSVKLPQMVVDELLTLKPKSAEYFFWSGVSSRRTLVSVWGERLRRIFQEAGIEKKGHMLSHRLRDTFAVKLLEAGVSLENVSTLLGHADLKVTQKHYSPWIKARQEALDAAVEQANGWHELKAKKPTAVVPIRRQQHTHSSTK